MPAPTPINLSSGSVLIVEDDVFIGEELRQAFHASGARTVGPALDIASALQISQAQRISLAVLDIRLGGDLVYPLASALRRRTVPIVFASGSGREVLPREFGDVEVITKPYDAMEFVRSLMKGPCVHGRTKPLSNELLAHMPVGCLEELRRHVSLAALRPGATLQRAGGRIDHVWFIESGLCLLSRRPGGVNTAMIGSEGAVGLEACIGSMPAQFGCMVAAPGVAVRIGATALRRTVERNPAAREMLLHYLTAVHAQTACTLESSATRPIRARIARWLLMASDRVGRDLPVTHELLSAHLGVRRASVTEALHSLEEKGALERRRGRIVIRDRLALEAKAEGYGEAETAYRRLLARDH